EGNEDSAIALDIHSALPANDAATVSLSITVSGLPAGAVLNHGTPNADGSWTLGAGDLAGLTVTPPAGFVGTLNLSVVATDTEASSGTSANTSGSVSVVID